MVNYFITFFGVLGSIWMLALANKIVSDAWDVLFKEEFCLWLRKIKEHSKEHIKKNYFEVKKERN